MGWYNCKGQNEYIVDSRDNSEEQAGFIRFLQFGSGGE